MASHPPGAFAGSTTTCPPTSAVGESMMSVAFVGTFNALFRFSVIDVEKLTMLFASPATMDPSPPNGPSVPYPDG